MQFRFQLGDRARDLVTGFSGVIISRTEYLNGCIRYGIQPPLDKDGKMPDAVWIDEQQLVPTGELNVKAAYLSKAAEYTGGDRPAPASRKDAPL